jgi:hypothetical protein
MRIFTTGIRTSVITGEAYEAMVGKKERGPHSTQ